MSKPVAPIFAVRTPVVVAVKSGVRAGRNMEESKKLG